MNTNIWTVICKYKYKYKYLSNTIPKINMLLYIKAIKVSYNAIYGILLNLCRLIKILIYLVSMSKTNTNTNIIWLIKKGKYKYEYTYSDWYLPIQIQIQIFVTHWFDNLSYFIITLPWPMVSWKRTFPCTVILWMHLVVTKVSVLFICRTT